MRSRALAVVLTLVSLAAFSGAAFFIWVSEQRIATTRAASRVFDAAVRNTTASVAEFDAERTTTSMNALRSMASNDKARDLVDQAAANIGDFTEIAPVIDELEQARLSEQQAAEAAEASRRRIEAIVLATMAGLGALTTATLAIAWPPVRKLHVDAAPAESSIQSSSETESPSTYSTARLVGPVLRSAAELCTNLGRVSDVDELRRLVAQAADLMDASGLIVWMIAPGATELRAALSHGYPAEMMSRLSALPRSADNAAARAFRSGQLQIVLARPGSSNGAIVAPLLTANGCVGVISAEIRGGAETSDSVQAFAAIVAAQLAGALHMTEPHEQRPTGTAGI
jgi:hypothetical protein